MTFDAPLFLAYQTARLAPPAGMIAGITPACIEWFYRMSKAPKKSNQPRRTQIKTKAIEGEHAETRDVLPKLPLARPKGWRKIRDGYFNRCIDGEIMLEIFKNEENVWLVARRTDCFQFENYEYLRSADDGIPIYTERFQGAMCLADRCHPFPPRPLFWCWMSLGKKPEHSLKAVARGSE